MGYLLAKSLLAATALSVHPTTRPAIAPALPPSDRVEQLNQDFERLTPPLDHFNLKPWSEIPTPYSSVRIEPYPLLPQPDWQLPIPSPSISLANIRPHGPSFQFNGLTVYVEPVATANPAAANRAAPAGAK